LSCTKLKALTLAPRS